ncbi:MAG: class I SAM-dependent methyltransferase [Pseudomonadales bacterium]|nr:class I SAM-dependent methyltransferase [Pseudomonadales bacterium]
MKMSIVLFLILWLFSLTALSSETTSSKIKSALDHERRTAVEILRDENRRAEETLTFFGFQAEMTVLELLPGTGWYTKILAPVLEDKGKLYISIGAESVYKSLEGKPGFNSLAIVPFDKENFSRIPGTSQVHVPEFSFGLSNIDMALTFRNLHNFTEEGRNNINKAVFLSLKSGGHYGVIDHTRRHMQPNDDEIWRRIDPVKIILEIESAGFKFIDYSDLHHHPDDELIYEVGRQSVSGNTDRFTLLFKKP